VGAAPKSLKLTFEHWRCRLARKKLFERPLQGIEVVQPTQIGRPGFSKADVHPTEKPSLYLVEELIPCRAQAPALATAGLLWCAAFERT
jgi:hypothetical protein